jgi:hypothetical protein
MNIEAESFKIEMTHDEMWSIAFDIRHALEATLKSHWVNHQDSWENNEEKRLYRINKFFTHLGRPDLYQDVFQSAKTIFEAFNSKK